ncbi:hypothetical protein STA3757_37480 [Stanieria sp. NIES-3757]|nr:hypothetical protein STA3757_37480 [Stanieria sp. NIES-3757]
MNKEDKHPALREEPIGEPASIIAPREDESIFRWIQSTGRFKPYESDKYHDHKAIDEFEDLLSQDEELDLEVEEELL